MSESLNLDNYQSFEPITGHGGKPMFNAEPKEGVDGGPRRFTENQILRAKGHNTGEREYYDLGFTDAGGTIPVVEAPVAATPAPEATPPSPPTRIEVTEPAPAPEAVAAAPTEAVPAPEEVEATAERENNHEAFRREYINPENIAQLKEQFQEEVEKEARRNRGAESLAQLRELDPYLAANAENYARARVLTEYFKTIERGPAPEELRNDVIAMMGLSDGTLRNLILRPEVEVPAEAVAEGTPENTAEVPPEGPESIWFPNTRRAWNRLRDFASGRMLLARFNTQAAEEEAADTTPERHRRRRGGLLLGGLALIGVGAAGIELIEHLLEAKGIAPNHGIGRGLREHVDLKGINPNTINAETPSQFQHGVLRLLNEQGVQAHGVTPERINHLNQYMETHNIASGMKNGTHGLEQNAVHFPGSGHEFVNSGASADQGFKLGSSGTGRERLDKWVREAEKIGIRFNRTKS